MLLAVCLVAVAGCTPPGLPEPLAPTVSSTAGTVTVPPTSVTIGIDGAAAGFNPHVIADFSPVTIAVASMVLPSASVYLPDGTTAFDPDLVDSAAVTSVDPFTVSYVLNRNASWSDGTPVTGEDFSYLAAQMSSAPGTIDAAGYRLIKQVRSREAGKVVDVEFSSPFADWRTLFGYLLPAHLLKDAPGGWTAAMNAGIPVSANRYKVISVDRTTGEITLQRNDKYWAGVSGPMTVVVRIGDATDLLAAFERGDLEAAQVRPSSQDATALAAVPPDRRVDVPEGGTIQLVMNTAAGPTADAVVRRAIVAALGQSTVIAALAGEAGAGAGPTLETPTGTPTGTPTQMPTETPTRTPTETPTGTTVRAPEPVGSMISLPATTIGDEQSPGTAATPDPEAALKELSGAGYRKAGVYLTRDGRPLVLRLAYPGADARLAAAAQVVQRELGGAGMVVDLVADGIQSVVTAAAAGSVDLSLLTVGRGSNDAVAASSAFGCPDSSAPPGGARGGNLSGYCSTVVEPILQRAMESGHAPDAAENPLVIDRPIWPIAQAVDTVVVSPALRGVVADAGPGWIFGGPFADVADWPLS